MSKLILAFSFLFLLQNSLSGQSQKEYGYVLPIKLPPAFSGGFGELRRNHFHTGLDFRTSGQTGIPVYSVQDGSVVRVSVSPYGYGHALYLAHPDGHTTVYGHLSRFSPKVEAYVMAQQYLLKKFAIDLSIPLGLFPVKKGEIAAWSGNSGSSGGPHLHFEIRDTKSEKPQNPLFYLPGIHDNSSPSITAVYLYPLSEKSQVSKSHTKIRLETLPSKRNTVIKSGQSIEVFGDIGIGIQSNDDLNGIGLKLGIFSAELYLDQEPVFSFKLDHLSFDLGRYVNSHIDYEELIRNNRWIHKLFLQPGNKMDIYQTNASKGSLRLEDGKIHTVKIVVSDAFNNSNTLTFKLLSKNSPLIFTQKPYTALFYSNSSNKFENDEVKIQLPEGSLYDNLKFEYQANEKKKPFYSKLHQIHNQYVAIHNSYTLSLKSRPVPSNLQSKSLIAMVSPAGKLSSVGGEYTDGWVTAHPRSFGNFAVVLDTIPPVIRAISIRENKVLLDKSKIEFKISDNLSGVEVYDGEIDGKWVLFEYDAKTETLSFKIDTTRIQAGKKHTLYLKVADERKNKSEYRANFYL